MYGLNFSACNIILMKFIILMELKYIQVVNTNEFYNNIILEKIKYKVHDR